MFIVFLWYILSPSSSAIYPFIHSVAYLCRHPLCHPLWCTTLSPTLMYHSVTHSDVPWVDLFLFQTWFAASDLGWVVGHSYIVYAPLFHCNTTVLYEVTHHTASVTLDTQTKYINSLIQTWLYCLTLQYDNMWLNCLAKDEKTFLLVFLPITDAIKFTNSKSDKQKFKLVTYTPDKHTDSTMHF